MEIFIGAFLLTTILGLSLGQGEQKKVGHLTQDQEKIVREVLWKQTTVQKTETKLLDDKVYE